MLQNPTEFIQLGHVPWRVLECGVRFGHDRRFAYHCSDSANVICRSSFQGVSRDEKFTKRDRKIAHTLPVAL